MPTGNINAVVTLLPGEPELANPFAGVDFADLEKSLRRPRTLINMLLSGSGELHDAVALVPLFSVIWMLLWRGGQKLSLACSRNCLRPRWNRAAASATPSSAL